MPVEDYLVNIFKTKILFDEPMKNHVSFKVGGKVDYLLLAESKEDIINAINICNENKIDFYILGNGSNVIVKDAGFRGMIIKILQKFNNIVLQEDGCIFAESGILLSSLANYACAESLSGFEFASGIPGSFGGAVYMNAGAYGGEIKDVLLKSTVFDYKTNSIFTLLNDELDFGYRTSRIEKQNLVVLDATIKLNYGDKKDIIDKMNDLNTRRKEKQPLNYPSAGSTFKRPEGYFAGKLIMDSGLRGAKIGGAEVSEKHCGFIINSGDATATDVINLIEFVKETVYEKFKIMLQPEVRIIGEGISN